MKNNGVITVEALTILIEKMEYDIEQTSSYIEKLKEDKTKMYHTLKYNEENLDYLRTHCGVIAIDYVKSIKNQIKRLRIFLEHSEEDIEKFEMVLEKQIKELEKKNLELEKLKVEMASRVVKFRGEK